MNAMVTDVPAHKASAIAAPVDQGLALRRRGGVAVWATAGAVWIVVATQAIVRWVLSPSEFAPAPVLGPDVFPLWRETSLRVLEVLSMAVLIGFVWFCVVKPWRRDGKLSLDGKFVIAGCFAAVADACLNLYNYLFAWNAHSFNRGVWAAFMPFHQQGSSTRYAEGLLWGVPMYIYFCLGAAIIGCAWKRFLRNRFPDISNAAAYSVVFVSSVIEGLLLENLIIRTTQAYGYAQTNGYLTLFPGSQYQYPVYESIYTGLLAVAFTYVRMSAHESADGVSCIERGFERWRPGLQTPIRLLAVCGFSAAALLFLYHLPFNWLGVGGTSFADLPSYMLAG
jgi:Spirocyclase AveC-like